MAADEQIMKKKNTSTSLGTRGQGCRGERVRLWWDGQRLSYCWGVSETVCQPTCGTSPLHNNCILFFLSIAHPLCEFLEGQTQALYLKVSEQLGHTEKKGLRKRKEGICWIWAQSIKNLPERCFFFICRQGPVPFSNLNFDLRLTTFEPDPGANLSLPPTRPPSGKKAEICTFSMFSDLIQGKDVKKNAKCLFFAAISSGLGSNWHFSSGCRQVSARFPAEIWVV